MPIVSAKKTANPRAVPSSPEANPFPEPAESVPPELRHMLIAEAAFRLAEARGFAPDHELGDWLAAEREIDQRLAITRR